MFYCIACAAAFRLVPLHTCKKECKHDMNVHWDYCEKCRFYLLKQWEDSMKKTQEKAQ